MQLSSIDPINSLIEDQFELMGIAAEKQDANTARFVSYFEKFSAELMKSNQVMSDRLLVHRKV